MFGSSKHLFKHAGSDIHAKLLDIKAVQCDPQLWLRGYQLLEKWKKPEASTGIVRKGNQVIFPVLIQSPRMRGRKRAWMVVCAKCWGTDCSPAAKFACGLHIRNSEKIQSMQIQQHLPCSKSCWHKYIFWFTELYETCN